LPSQNDPQQIDVTVLGGGLAGMAASIHLVRAGLRVLCIEAQAADTTPVGESLDWSAPELLAGLGLPMQKLIDEGFGTWKRHVTCNWPTDRPHTTFQENGSRSRPSTSSCARCTSIAFASTPPSVRLPSATAFASCPIA
jgi:2-polyprenyl-6-methoxyphenol hydroxylase-like FAD-dependent oxidoreductase